MDLAADFFAFKFSNEEENCDVFSSEPWFLRGQTLFLIPWRENFEPMRKVISVDLVWVQFSGLLVEFLNQKIFPQVAIVVGRPIKIDEYTLSGVRVRFVRVCILLDVRKPLEQDFWIESKGGGRIAHNEANCKQLEEKNLKCENKEGSKDEKEERLLGPWVQVKKRRMKAFY
ncbi:hypothetical protein Cni_G09751 [Canna indica]|uniref:DUF4283 domain-containing protein n=1 Tax=Canna indica TaxID=4628 RepID=A0AAQ3K321_9LILI|nr:hypothetical protein Cni_G09751 [Canna indica]